MHLNIKYAACNKDSHFDSCFSLWFSMGLQFFGISFPTSVVMAQTPLLRMLSLLIPLFSLVNVILSCLTSSVNVCSAYLFCLQKRNCLHYALHSSSLSKCVVCFPLVWGTPTGSDGGGMPMLACIFHCTIRSTSEANTILAKSTSVEHQMCSGLMFSSSHETWLLVPLMHWT